MTGTVFRMPLFWNRGRQLPLPHLPSPSHLITVYRHRQWNIASILSINRLGLSHVADPATATSLLLKIQPTGTVLEYHSLASIQKEMLRLW